MKSAVLVATTSLLTGCAWAISPRTNSLVPPPLRMDEATPGGTIQKRAVTGQGVFQQLLDHDDPSLGTFNQSFWWSSEFWQGPGSPVVFFTPGEIAAESYTGYLTNRTITGQFAQAIGGAVVMMEHRYWGDSSPYTVLTAENLTYLTLANSIHDTTYFANNVVLPFDTNGSSSAANAPWVFSGGSYSGALSAWTESVDPGTFWAYHATSAVVQAVYDFWWYFDPVRQGMPQNCSSDVIDVIKHVDSILLSNDTVAKQALKEKFGLGAVEHDDDFANVLQNGPWQWQSNDFYTGYTDFYIWCDAIENVGPLYPNATIVPGAEGVGLEKALNGYAKWVKEYLLPDYCADYGYDDWTESDELGCFNSYNASSPIYTDIVVDNEIDRQWEWMLCNEPFAFWQDGASDGSPTIVSTLITAEYWQRQCELYFPPNGSYGSAQGQTVTTTNTYTNGWDIAGTTTRLIFTNGQYDPWLDATVSSQYKPGGPFNGTDDAPVLMIPDGIPSLADDILDSMHPRDTDNDGVVEERGPLGNSGEALEPFLPDDEREKRAKSAKHVRWAININVAVNVLLLAAKGVAAIWSSSLSLIASLVDSALDLLCTVIIWTTNRLVGWRLDKLKKKFPVGRRRLEPLGILVFSIIMVISFLQILQESVKKLLPSGEHNVATLPPAAIFAMVATIVVKGTIWIGCARVKTTQVQALAQDCKTDVYFNTLSLLFPLIGHQVGVWWLDPVGASILSLFIIYDWAGTCLENMTRLTGEAANDRTERKLMFMAYRFEPLVEGFKSIKAYHAGDGVCVEIDVLMPEDAPLRRCHDVAETLQYCLEGLSEVDRAFVTVDYLAQGPTGHGQQDGE